MVNIVHGLFGFIARTLYSMPAGVFKRQSRSDSCVYKVL